MIEGDNGTAPDKISGKTAINASTGLSWKSVGPSFSRVSPGEVDTAVKSLQAEFGFRRGDL
jgi:hypothetical protein